MFYRVRPLAINGIRVHTPEPLHYAYQNSALMPNWDRRYYFTVFDIGHRGEVTWWLSLS